MEPVSKASDASSHPLTPRLPISSKEGICNLFMLTPSEVASLEVVYYLWVREWKLYFHEKLHGFM